LEGGAYPLAGVDVSSPSLRCPTLRAEGTHAAMSPPSKWWPDLSWRDRRNNDYVARHGNRGWDEAILYTIGEPRTMCMSAMVWAGMGPAGDLILLRHRGGPRPRQSVVPTDMSTDGSPSSTTFSIHSRDHCSICEEKMRRAA
jgi:hypothetical protein